MEINDCEIVFKSENKNYAKINLIGQGAFSNVFLVKDELSQERFQFSLNYIKYII